ncbi:MAG: helix-turn-helix domain-containing protein [bacterium]|nr:helix-turn-helix domain-containing protein [bacterium]
MKEIGDIFKEKREEIGITIEEVSSDLKIDSVLIDNLEEGNDRVFKDILELKDVIKLYAKYLGLDEQELLEEYQDYVFSKTSKISVYDIKEGIENTKKEEEIEKKIKSPYTTGLDYNYKKDKNIVIILCIVLIIILILMYMIVRNFILG